MHFGVYGSLLELKWSSPKPNEKISGSICYVNKFI